MSKVASIHVTLSTFKWIGMTWVQCFSTGYVKHEVGESEVKGLPIPDKNGDSLKNIYQFECLTDCRHWQNIT